MNLYEIRYICRDNDEWIDCQKILLNNGFQWESGEKLFYGPYYLKFPCSIVAYNNDKKIYWSQTLQKVVRNWDEMKLSVTMEAKTFIRKYKLEKLNKIYGL